MKSHIVSAIIGLIFIISVGSFVYVSKKPSIIPPEAESTAVSNIEDEIEDEREDELVSNTAATPPAPAPATSAPQPKPSTGFTLAQVASHNARTSCWSAINGNVYDLTSWIPNHPGGEQRILSLCGIDGSSKYNGKHGSSAKTAGILVGFKIVALAK